MIWFATLVIWPSPLPPTSVMFLPMRSKSGFTWSNAAWLPPTMIVRLAALAPTSPPETGASRYSQPSSFTRLAKPLVATGEMELMSTTILPFTSPSAIPPGAKRADSTWGVSGTMVMMMSEACATSLPLAHAFTPAAIASCGTLGSENA